MNRRGRPPRDDEGKKSARYMLRLSEDEEDILENLSYEYGLSKAEILRRGLRMQNNLLHSARN
jgi:hypothetical protein